MAAASASINPSRRRLVTRALRGADTVIAAACR
jgi:hypothetical protein